MICAFNIVNALTEAALGAAPKDPDGRGWRTVSEAMNIERLDVSATASISAGIADRYATALFDLSKETKAVDALHKDVASLAEAVNGSDALADLLNSPLYSRDDQEAGIAAVASKLGLGDAMSNTLRLMAQKRRLFVVPALLTALRERIAEEKGIVTAEVSSAKALTKTQADKLAKVLKAKVGQDVEINATVDESLIGGLVVKLGSKMIDTSIRSKLAALQNSMKEVG